MLIEAFNYKGWADRRTLDAVESMDAKAYPAAVGFALQQFNHMIRVEELFRARLIGAAAPHHSTNTAVVPGLDEIEQRICDSNQWFSRYVRDLEPDRLRQAVRFQFVDGKNGTMTPLEILFHVVNHGTYHRGAIGHGLDLTQVAHPADTYTVFIHATEPQRRGPG
jgi:uncharacterized damage-inducible protein DinB